MEYRKKTVRNGGVHVFFHVFSHVFWVNYNDLTVLPHWKSWFRYREIIPKWPNYSG